VLSVNLSAAQLHEPALAAEVEQALRAAGVAPGQVGLELTESMLLEGAPHTLVALAQLKALGVRLALDDFGTGYASFAYLKRFPVDTLKLDRSFVAGLGRDPGDTAIVRAMVTMAHALGQRVTAEGVERAEQVAELRALGCDTGQGYYFAAPLAGAAAGALLGQPAPPWGTAGAQG
jgi:EAL domain-containing protein (putative c-di-GMP-specific phosphodiesterase class I)